MSHRRTLATALLSTLVSLGCSSDAGNGEHAGERPGEHDRESGEHGDEGGEESGTELAQHETYDEVRGGVRLILTYDAQGRTFRGTMENGTEEVVKRARVEVHLSNGRELGPTTPVDLAPGETSAVELKAASSDFDGWSAHAEVGSGEHGGAEGHDEHD